MPDVFIYMEVLIKFSREGCYMYKIVEKVLKTSDALEDYRGLKENISNVEYSLKASKLSYEYAKIRVKSE
jgi:hypothetical protein